MSLLKACNGGDTTVDLTQGLVVHYLLNNNADDSHGTYDGTSVGGVDFQGDVAKFDGVDDYIYDSNYSPVDVNYNDSPFTISGWYERTGTASSGAIATGDVHPIIDFDDHTSSIMEKWSFVFMVNMDTDTVTIQILSGTSANRIKWFDTATGVDLSVGKHHYVVQYDGTKSTTSIRVWIDGTEITVGTGVEEGTYLGMVVSEPILGSTIKYAVNYYRYANGKLSNVRIYNEAKDQTFIDALYAEGYYPKPLPLPTTTGLIAHYPLTGTAEDTTGNYDGTEVGNTYIDSAEFGSVASFDGATSKIYTTSGTTVNSGDISISIWVKIDTATTSMIAIAQTGSPTNDAYRGILFTTSSEVVAASRDASGGFFSTRTTITQTEFNHVVLVDKGTTTELYVNGLYISSVDRLSSYIFNNDIVFGCRYHDTPDDLFLDGVLSDARIYNRAITATEITDIYNYEKNFRPIDIDDGLVAYYPLAENSLDNYKNQYDGTDTSMTYDGLSGVFNGTTSAITKTHETALDVNTTGKITISAWVFCNNFNSDESAIFGKMGYAGSTSEYSYQFRINNLGQVAIGHFDGSIWAFSPIDATVAIQSGQWYHLIGEIENGGEVKVTIDTVEKTGSTARSTTASRTVNVDIGRRSIYYLDGKVAKVRVYNKLLSQEQKAIIYNTEKGDFI